MNIRMAGCRDCEQITSGDCGKHGPLQVGSITFQQHPDWPVTFTGSTALAVEIAALRARAEKAEAELAELKAKLTAGLLPPQWEDISTAPKDQSTIIGYASIDEEGFGEVVDWAFWENGLRAWVWRGGLNHPPTHWMPFPVALGRSPKEKP